MIEAIFELKADSLEDAASLINRTLKVQLDLKDSDFKGVYYASKRTSDGKRITVEENFNEYEDGWTIPEYQEIEFLLFLNCSEDDIDLKVAENRFYKVSSKSY